MNKKYLISALSLILILLFVANIFRYETQASKTTDNVVIKWTKDRWTGVEWTSIYNTNNVNKFPTNYPNTSEKDLIKLKVNEKRATITWNALVLISIVSLLWLAFTMKSAKEKEGV